MLSQVKNRLCCWRFYFSLMLIICINQTASNFTAAQQTDSKPAETSIQGELDSAEPSSDNAKATDTAKTNIQSTDDPSVYESTVGFPKLIFQKVIEGPKLVAKPIRDKKQAMVVRIVATYPHGEHFRYDIEYKALDAGKYDVAEYLIREDGSDEPIEPINVTVKSILGPGQVVPYELPPLKNRYNSFYLPLLFGGIAIWIAGLLAILFYGRGKSKRPETQKQKATVADRLEPLLSAAASGEINSQQQAELERVLSSFWSKKLRLGHLNADQLRQHLREHSEASVLLDQLDSWIHKPKVNGTHQFDVKILEPYRSMSYEEVN